jgi:hypothetical protein
MSYYDGTDVFILGTLMTVFLGGLSTAISCEVGKGMGWEKRNDQLVEERSEAVAAPLVRELLTSDAFEKFKACTQVNPCREVEDSDDRVVCHEGFMRSCLGVKPRAEAGP